MRLTGEMGARSGQRRRQRTQQGSGHRAPPQSTVDCPATCNRRKLRSKRIWIFVDLSLLSKLLDMMDGPAATMDDDGLETGPENDRDTGSCSIEEPDMDASSEGQTAEENAADSAEEEDSTAQAPGATSSEPKGPEEASEASASVASASVSEASAASDRAAQPLLNNSGLYQREMSVLAEKQARIEEQKKKQQQAEMKDVTFSPRINPALPMVGSTAGLADSQPRTPGAAEVSMKQETAARVANGFWPVFPTPDRQRAPAGIKPVVPRTGSGRVVSGGAGEAAAPKLERGKAAPVEPRHDPTEYAKKRLEMKRNAERLRAEHKGR